MALGKLIMHPTGLRADRPRPARTFRYYWSATTRSGVEVHRSVVMDVVDQWDGSAGAACVALEADLQLLAGPGLTVTVTGGYV